MKSEVPNNHIQRFCEFVSHEMGLNLSQESLSGSNQLTIISNEFGFTDSKNFVTWISSKKLGIKQIKILADHLTVGETYFFREKKSFEILKTQLLPKLIKLKEKTTKTIRIWSAGCSSGEEPYSIAILLQELIPDIQQWNISILATDINSTSLTKARAGIYSKWAFREGSEWILGKYFNKLGKNKFEISTKIKKMVRFSYHNLANPDFTYVNPVNNSIDILFCRNVLMYFKLATTYKILKRFSKLVTNEGWLLLSAVETNLVKDMVLKPVIISDKTFYTKNKVKLDLGYNKQYFSPSSFILKQISEPSQILSTPKRSINKPQKTASTNKKKGISSDINKQTESAVASFFNSEYEEAIKKITILIAINKDYDSNLLMLMARSYANIGNVKDALIWIEKAIYRDKTNIEYRLFHAEILQESGNIQKTLESYKKVLYLDPEVVVAHFSIASILRSSNKQNESNKYFNNAITLLRNRNDNEILEASEGITAGRLKEIISTITSNN